MFNRRSSARACAVAVIAVGASHGGSAAVLEEVVVTARKVEESLQSAPVAVSAFTGEALEERSIDSVNEVAVFAPNVTAGMGYNGGAEGFYYIRGIGINDFTAAMDPPVGVYLDGVYLGRTAGNAFDLVDVDRIEILRGPQGTLFGRNTSGGAINVVSSRPRGEFGGRAAIIGGSRDRIEGRITVDFPVIEGMLAGRASFLHKEQDGWVDNLADGRTLGDIDTDAARLSLLWTPAERLEVLGTIDYATSNNTRVPQNTTDADPTTSSPCPPFCIPLPADILTDVRPSYDTSWSGAPVDTSTDVYGASVVIDWDVGPFALKSITSWRELDQHTRADFDVTRFNFYDNEVPIQQDQLSQELQISGSAADERIDWLAGVFYFRERVDQTNAINLGATGPLGVLGVPFAIPLAPGVALPVVPLIVDPALKDDDCCRIQARQRIMPRTEAFAVFGQATVHFTQRLSLTAGLRWSHDDKKQGYDFITDNTIPGHPLYPLGRTQDLLTEASNHWASLDPRVGFEYQATDDVMLYVSYAEGFRSGGFNSRPVVLPVGSFDPEEVSTIEVGMKSEWLDRRVRLNAAAFRSDYEGLQIQVLSGGFFDIKNAGEAQINGIEVELLAVPVDGLTLNAGLGYLDAEYESVTADALAAGVELGDELPMTPEWTWNAGAQYMWPLAGDWGTLSVRVDYAYTDSRFSFANNAPGNKLDAYSLVNARGSWESHDGKWRLSVFGLNVLDEEYYRWAEDVRFTASPLGTLILYPAPPAEWGAELQYRF